MIITTKMIIVRKDVVTEADVRATLHVSVCDLLEAIWSAQHVPVDSAHVIESFIHLVFVPIITSRQRYVAIRSN